MQPLLESLFAFLFKYRLLIYRQGDLAFAVSRATAIGIGGAFLAAVVIALTYARVQAQGRRRHRYLLAGARIAVFALLCFCLMRPSLSVPALLEQRGYVAVLVDHSRSMNVADENGGTRAQAAASLIAPDAAMRRQLEARFRVRYFDFGGAGTDIGAALERATGDLSGLPLAGVVVVSDGADNAQRAWSESLRPLQSARVPVFTIALGRESGERDVRITRVSIPATVLKDATVIADAELQFRDLAGTEVRVEIEDAGRLLAHETIRLPRGSDVAHVSLSFPATEPGPRRLRVRVAPVPGEKLLQNNERQALLDVRNDRQKILLMDGEPRFEDKFLRRALVGENNVQLVQLLRTAPKKFLRLDVDSASELANGFPTSRAELFKYRALVLGSVEASFFTHDQLEMIADFVSARGGSLLVLGGPKSLAEGGWAGTAVADALPVALERSTAPVRLTAVHVRPTQAGATHPIALLDSTPEASAARWLKLPALSTVNVVGALKPGATALLVADSSQTPVLAYQRYGRGHVFVFTPQDSWLWQMHHDIAVDDQTHETFWRQLLRYIAQDRNERVQLNAAAVARVGQEASLDASVFDTAFRAIDGAQVNATVRAPDGSERKLALPASPQGYSASFRPTEAGVHEVTLVATRGDERIGEAHGYVSASDDDVEMFDPAARPGTLKRIAEDTHGRHYTPQTASAIPEDISVLGHGITVRQQKELWDMPAVFLLMLIALCAEWLYRRRKGLV